MASEQCKKDQLTPEQEARIQQMVSLYENLKQLHRTAMLGFKAAAIVCQELSAQAAETETVPTEASQTEIVSREADAEASQTETAPKKRRRVTSVAGMSASCI